MYLSKLVLNPRCRQALKEVDDPYQMHRTLARAFGVRLVEARLLFRVDWPENENPHIIAQSQVKPDWSALPKGYCKAMCKNVGLDLQKNLRLPFRLLARPSRRALRAFSWWTPAISLAIARSDLKPEQVEVKMGDRIGCRSDKEQRAWLERKAQDSGFCVLSVQASSNPWHDSRGGAKSKTLGAVQFDGILVVADPDKLNEAVRNGIGPQKAFGFGLLSLASALP